jgi:hypothetical protein
VTATSTLPSRSVGLWYGVLAGPVLWATQLYVNYQWEEVLACSPATSDTGAVLGLDVRTWILLVNAVAAAGTVVALAVAVRRRRTVKHPAARWLARAGILNSVLFLFLIVVGFAPPIMLNPCQAPL